MQRKNLFILICVLLIVVVLSGCQQQTASPSPSPLSTSDILEKSSQQTQALNVFHFALDQVGGGTPIAMGIEMKSAEGDIEKPDKLQTTINGTALGFALQVKLVTSGQVTYMTNPVNQNWELLPSDFKVLALLDPGTGISAIIKTLANPVKLQDEVMEGVASYHLTGTVQSDQLQPITGSAVKGVAISAEVWIGKDDFLPRKIKLTGKITATEVDGIVRTLTLSNFNQAVDIKLPV